MAKRDKSIVSRKLDLAAARARRRAVWAAASVGRGIDSSRLDQGALEAAERDVLTAERELAQARGDEYAVAIELPWRWSGGAPLPFVVSNGYRAAVLFYLNVPDPAWDGTYATMVDPASPTVEQLGVIEFTGVYDIAFGGLNDEAIKGHPLAGKGLEPYSAHQIHDSRWIAKSERRNSVHPSHRGGWHQRLNHYLLCFHDETLECIAAGFETRTITASYREAVQQISADLVGLT